MVFDSSKLMSKYALKYLLFIHLFICLLIFLLMFFDFLICKGYRQDYGLSLRTNTPRERGLGQCCTGRYCTKSESFILQILHFSITSTLYLPISFTLYFYSNQYLQLCSYCTHLMRLKAKRKRNR